MNEIPHEILDRYASMLEATGAHVPATPEPEGRDSTHLLWMLNEIRTGAVTGDKAHRWLGYVQGMMIADNLTSVQAERDFTRPLFNRFALSRPKGTTMNEITDKMVETMRPHFFNRTPTTDEMRKALSAVLAAAEEQDHEKSEALWSEHAKAHAGLYEAAEKEFFANVTLPTQAAAEEQQPVAWRYKTALRGDEDTWRYFAHNVSEFRRDVLICEPLYTRPSPPSGEAVEARRLTLDVDEIAAAFQDGFTNGNMTWLVTPEHHKESFREGARCVIRALTQKDKADE